MEEIDTEGVDGWVKAAGSLSALVALSLSECDFLTGESLEGLEALGSLSLLTLRGCFMVMLSHRLASPRYRGMDFSTSALSRTSHR